MKELFFLLFITLFLSCNNKNKIDGLKDIYIGMLERDVKKELYDSKIILYGIETKINFHYCDDLFQKRKLSAVTFETNEIDKLYNKLNLLKGEKLFVEKISLRSSMDLMVSFDSLVCLRNDRIKFYKEGSILLCD